MSRKDRFFFVALGAVFSSVAYLEGRAGNDFWTAVGVGVAAFALLALVAEAGR